VAVARRCPLCRGLLDTEGPAACICDEVDARFPAADLKAEEWEALRHDAVTRSGGCCELRIPGVCLGAPRSRKGALPGALGTAPWSLHHRQPRGMGGTSRANVHSLAVLVVACGHGTAGCHGWVEHHRAAARDRGLLVPMGVRPRRRPSCSGSTLTRSRPSTCRRRPASPPGPCRGHAAYGRLPPAVA
jgi:hypothetical protein